MYFFFTSDGINLSHDLGSEVALVECFDIM